jgi:hypothetical protein
VTAPAGDDAIGRALRALAGWLDAAGAPYALIGGVAVGLQSEPRFTQDVDAVVWIDDARWGGLLEAALAYGIRPRLDDPIAFARQVRVLLLSHEGVVPIDLSCGALPFEQDLVEQAATIDVGSASIRVARPVHLLVTKAIANRPRDRADIAALLEAHPDVDVAAARRVIAEFAQALEQPELLDGFDRLVRDVQR